MTDHQQPLTETQAPAWLHYQPDGTIATTVSDLARPVAGTGRPRPGTSRYGFASSQAVRTPGPDGRFAFTARTPCAPRVCMAASFAYLLAESIVIPPVSLCNPLRTAATRSGSRNMSERRGEGRNARRPGFERWRPSDIRRTLTPARSHQRR